MAFEQLFQLIKTAIEKITKIQPDFDPLLRQLQAVGEIFKKYSSTEGGNLKDESGLTDANLLWQAIEPVIYLHDRVSKYLQEDQEDAKQSTQDYSSAHGQLGDYTNQLVYKYLAVMLESSVRELRNAVKAARDRVDEEAAKSDSAQVYVDANASDPSHSDLSKDHFSNILNQPAGLVAAVITNWTTQQVVRCWDDPRRDAEACIDEILTVLHHPAFPEKKTVIQEYMFDAVTKWWDANSADEKERVRAKLTKDAVQQRQHEDHTLTLKDFDGKHPGPAGFPGAWPEVRQPPRKASLMQTWSNQAIADFNWGLRIVQKGWTDPMGAQKELFRASGSLVHNMVLVIVALAWTVVRRILWLFSWLFWPIKKVCS